MLNIFRSDWTQRITLGGAIVCMAYFAAHTIEKERKSTPAPASSAQSTSPKELPKPDAPKQPPSATPHRSKTKNQPKFSRFLMSLSDGQRFVLKQKLTAYAGSTVRLVRVGGDPQTGIVFEQLVDIFTDANWKTETAEIRTVSVIGVNFPNSSYLTGPNIAAPVIRRVFSIFADAGIDLPLTPDAFSGPTSNAVVPDIVIVIK
jgi:hypothetical protein